MNRAGVPQKNSSISDSSAFPMGVPFSNHNQTHWRNTAMVCDCDSSKITEHSLLTMQPCGFNRYQSRRQEKMQMPRRLPPGFIFSEVGKLVGKSLAFIRKGY